MHVVACSCMYLDVIVRNGVFCIVLFCVVLYCIVLYAMVSIVMVWSWYLVMVSGHGHGMVVVR